MRIIKFFKKQLEEAHKEGLSNLTLIRYGVTILLLCTIAGVSIAFSLITLGI